MNLVVEVVVVVVEVVEVVVVEVVLELLELDFSQKLRLVDDCLAMLL